MSFLLAVPIIGKFLDGVFSGVDKITTTDEERLKFKTNILEAQVPLLLAIVQADAALQRARAEITMMAMKSDHWVVYALRPFLSVATFAHWMAINTNLMGGNADHAFYAFGVVFGIFGTSRGVEKVARIFKQKEQI